VTAAKRSTPLARAKRARLTLGAVIAALIGAALWVVAERVLLPTTVPAGLHLPRLSPSSSFGRAYLQRSASYERFLTIDALLAELTLIAVLVAYALRGHRLMGESAAGPIGTGMMLGMLGFAVVWIAELPFGLAAVWWERRHGISHQGYLAWIFESFAALGGRFLFVSLALLIAMGLARLLRGWWWIAAAPAFGGLALLSAFLAIYLIPSVHPLADRALLAEARALARAAGAQGTKFEVQEVSRHTTAPNAEAVGFGSTRSVILWDTLLQGGFSRRELRAVIAHELGHISHDDVLKGVGWLALLLIPIAGLIALATKRRGGMARPEAVPVALLVLVGLMLVLTPLRNVISRRVEAGADWAALEATHDPAAQRGLMRKLARESLADPSPPTWSYVLFATHPTIMQRIAMADAWASARRPSAR
jgi:Zn-dependent protease with chaperone function